MSVRQVVIRNFIKHELGEELEISNSEYDKLLEQVKSEDPGFDPFEYLPTPEGSTEIEHRSGLIWLEKWSPENNDIRQYWNKEDGKVKTPKYDGSSGVIYYSDGKLDSIASMGNKSVGINQTDKLKHLVPNEVSPEISFLRFELLVDSRKYENARGKANGLMNSKYLEDEIDSLVTLVVFQGCDIYGNLIDVNRLRNIPEKYRTPKDAPYFIISPEVQDIELLDERGFSRIVTDNYDFQFCIDGIVYSKDSSYMDNWCYKYDYLLSGITTVNDIYWSETNGEGYTPVLSLEPINLDNKWMYNVSTNGVPNLLYYGCGVGSEIEVAFSKMTIPKIISVKKTTEITFPKCSCGNQLTKDNIQGALIRCMDPECSHKLELRESWMKNYLDDKDEEISDNEYILKHLEWFVFTLLNIPRFNYESKRYNEYESFKVDLYQSIKDKDYEGFNNLIYKNYSMTDSNWDNLVVNSVATINIINKYIHD